MQRTNESLWLVKSGGRIIGPYSNHQMNELLRDRVIVALDEACRSGDRWKYIRDEIIFSKVLEEVRMNNVRGVSDDTTKRNIEDTGVTFTQTSLPLEIDDMTEEITSHLLKDSIKDISFRAEDDHAPTQTKVSDIEGYSHANDFFVQKQANESAKWMWVVAILVIVVASATSVFKKYISLPGQMNAISSESTMAGLEAVDFGNYKRALDLLNRSNELNPNDTSIYLYLGILKTQIEKQPFQGRKLLEKLKDSNNKDLKLVLTGIGVSLLSEGDIRGAEYYFNKALDLDPLYDIAVINLGAAAMYSEDWARANIHLQLAIKDGSADGNEILMLIETLSKLNIRDKENRFLGEATRYINSFLMKGLSHQLEVNIGAAFIDKLAGEKAGIYKRIDSVLDMDFRATENFKQNLFLFRSRSDWSVISQWCLRTTIDLDPTARVIAFEALCMMKSGDLVEANKKIENAIAQDSKDPLVLGVYSYILHEMNSAESEAITLKKAIQYDVTRKYSQPLRQMAESCRLSGDAYCEKSMLQLLLDRNPHDLMAMAGMARLFLAEGKVVEAKKYVQQAKNITTMYIPIRMLNSQLSKLD